MGNQKYTLVRIALATLLIAGVLGVHPAHAQAINFGWAQRMGGTLSDSGSAIAIDSSGNVFTAGFTTKSVGNEDILFTKLNSKGDLVWSREIGASSYDIGQSVVVDNSGNVVVTGMFSGTVDFDPGLATSELTSVGFYDVFISKWNSNGDLVWAKSLGSALPDIVYDIALDSSGNVYTTGRFYDTVDFDPGPGVYNLNVTGNEAIFVSKLDTNGNFVWAKSVNGPRYIFGLSIAVDADGSAYTTGCFEFTVDFDPGPQVYNLTSKADSYDAFVSKLDSDGDFVWAKSRGGSTSEGNCGYGITVDLNGNVFTTGHFKGTVDFDPGAGSYNLTSLGDSDIFVSVLANNGDFVWAKSVGGMGQDNGMSLTVDTGGSVYATGYFQNTIDFDPDAGVNNLTSLGNTDIFISKLNGNGSFLWAKSMGGTDVDHGTSIALDSDANIYTTGDFKLTVDFDPGAGTTNLTSAGDSDIFVSKLFAISNTPTPTVTHTTTITPTETSTASSTPTPNCSAVYHGPLTLNGELSMSITNQTGISLAVQDVFVTWNDDHGHSAGADKTLRLQQASLNGISFWNGNEYGPVLTITPSGLSIPPGESTILFNFHQGYDVSDGSERVLIVLGTNGCQSYPIDSNTAPATHTPTPTLTATPPYSYNPLYLSLTGSQTIGGISSADEDILRFDGQNWSLFFDGSDVGVGSPDLFAFSIVDANTILMSFSANVTVNGITASPQDVLRFDSSSLGNNTAGTFSIYFDGSDVGLDTTAEKIDSLSWLPDGRLLISTTGNPAVPGLSGLADEDILAFTPASLGNETGGTWALYFDGSDVGLSTSSGEDVDALDVVGGNIYLSTLDNFSVTGVSGADEDVFVCTLVSLGSNTACSYSPVLYFDGSTWGLSANDVDAFNFLSIGPVLTSTPSLVPSSTLTNTPTRTPSSTATPTITPTKTPTATLTPSAPRGVFDVSILSHEPNPSTIGEVVTITVSVTDVGGGPAGSVTVNIVSDEGNTSCTTSAISSSCSSQLKFNNPFGHLIRASVGGDFAEADHYVNPPATDTLTYTPTATATPSNTPTSTGTAGGSDFIVADGFEGGNLSAWSSSTTDAGDLQASSIAALVGSYGLQAVIDDANVLSVVSDHPAAEPRYRARFYFDPNAISMASGDIHVILRGYSGASLVVLRVEFGYAAAGYQIRAGLMNDSSVWTSTSWFSLTDAPHAIELDWRAASGAGANDGGLTLWIDGLEQQNVTGIDNDSLRIDRVLLGALSSIDPGTRGIYYFDAFESRKQSYIGP